MWCSQCGQDVPAIGSPASGGVACARCGAMSEAQQTRSAALVEAADHGLDLTSRPAAAEPGFDDWLLEQNVHRMQARMGIKSPRHATPRMQRQHVPMSAPTDHASRLRPVAQERVAARPSLAAWLLMSLGLVAFAAGSVLLGWSILENRPDLWTMGLPITAGGQVALLVGLVLQLERVFQNNRYAISKLGEVDSQIDDLERTTTALGITHSSAAQAFYSHMSDQADPRVLLADLKGQIDLLAVTLAKRGGMGR